MLNKVKLKTILKWPLNSNHLLLSIETFNRPAWSTPSINLPLTYNPTFSKYPYQTSKSHKDSPTHQRINSYRTELNFIALSLSLALSGNAQFLISYSHPCRANSSQLKLHAPSLQRPHAYEIKRDTLRGLSC